MALQTLNTIKQWFRTGLKPTQAQFWDTWDSFRHKFEKIPVKDIDGIDELLLSKADKTVLDNHLADKNAHAPQVNTDWNSESGFSQLLNKPKFRTVNGQTIVGTGDIAITTESADLQSVLDNGSYAKLENKTVQIYNHGANPLDYSQSTSHPNFIQITNMKNNNSGRFEVGRGFANIVQSTAEGNTTTVEFENNFSETGNKVNMKFPSKPTGDYTLSTTSDFKTINGESIVGEGNLDIEPQGLKSVLDADPTASYGESKTTLMGNYGTSKFNEIIVSDETEKTGIYQLKNQLSFDHTVLDSNDIGNITLSEGNVILTRDKSNNQTVVDISDPVANTQLRFPAKSEEGKTYTIATTEDFKTINGESIVGSGDISVSGGAGDIPTLQQVLDKDRNATNASINLLSEEGESQTTVHEGGLNISEKIETGFLITDINKLGVSVSKDEETTFVNVLADELSLNKKLSGNPVKQGIVLNEDSSGASTIKLPLTSDGDVKTLATTKDFKTINGESIVGEGDITIEGGTTPDATTAEKGIVKLIGDLGGTADAPTTPTAIHITGNESFTGLKSSTNTGIQPDGQNGGFDLINDSDEYQVLKVVNQKSGESAVFDNNSSGTGLKVNNLATGSGISLRNEGSGTGFNILNLGGGYANVVNNIGDGSAYYIANNKSGNGIVIQNILSGAGLQINNRSTGYALDIFEEGSATSLNILKSNDSTATAIKIVQTGGIGIDLYNELGSAGGIRLVNRASSYGAQISNDSSGQGLNVFNSQGGIGIDVQNQSGGNGININNIGNAGLGINLINSGLSDGIDIDNVLGGRGIFITNRSSGEGIVSVNTANGDGIYLLNNSTGRGLNIANQGAGKGILVNNILNGNGQEISNKSGGTGVYLTNTANGTGYFISNTGTGIGMRLDNWNSNSGIYVANNSIGRGHDISNKSTGIGINVDNSSTGIGINLNNYDAGNGFVSNVINAGATGKNFVGKNLGATTFEVDKTGNVLGRILRLGSPSGSYGLFSPTDQIAGSGSTTDLNAYVYGNNPFGIWTNGVKRVTVGGDGNATFSGTISTTGIVATGITGGDLDDIFLTMPDNSTKNITASYGTVTANVPSGTNASSVIIIRSDSGSGSMLLTDYQTNKVYSRSKWGTWTAWVEK